MAARARTIVVGYDGSPAARRALDAAADLTGYGSTLSVVRIAPTVEGRAHPDGTVLVDARRRLLERHVTAVYLERVGEPAERLVEAAGELGADLLVVGRRGEPGSVSARVAQLAACDVLVVE